MNSKRPFPERRRQLTRRSLRSESAYSPKPPNRKPHNRLPAPLRRGAPNPWLAPGGSRYEAGGRPRFGGTATRWCGIGERFPGWPCCSCSDLPFLSRARICGRTIFDSLAGVEERTCGFRTVDGGRSTNGCGTVRALGVRKLDRFTPCELSPAALTNFRSRRRHRPARGTRPLHQTPIPGSTMCGHSMPVRSRGAMRTTWWQRTARSLAFLAVTAAGWRLRWLTFGLGWTLVRILAGE